MNWSPNLQTALKTLTLLVVIHFQLGPYDCGPVAQLSANSINQFPVNISVADGQVLLEWSPVPGALHYNVYECNINDTVADSLITSTDTTSIQLPLTKDKQFFRVSADVASYTVSIVFNGTSVSVQNPLDGAGISIAVTGADVVVNAQSGLPDINYVLSGQSSAGLFKIYSDQPFNLHLNGLTLTNPNGPAINNQADDEVTVELVDGTTSTLTDGLSYTDAPAEEDQKAAFFSEGQLIFTGTGTLTVVGRGSDKHALASDDYIAIQSGNIVIQNAVMDGIHTNEGYYQQGGSVTVSASLSDGVDAGTGPVMITNGSLTITGTADDSHGIKCDETISISGGTVNLNIKGNQSKGIEAAVIDLLGGTVTVDTSGGVVLQPNGSGYTPAYCTAVKADTRILLEGCLLNITTVGPAGRGISSDGDIVVKAGNLSVTSSGAGSTYTNESGVRDACLGPCLKADGNLVIEGGSVILSHSGAGGKGISGNGTLAVGSATSSPSLKVTTTGSSISIGNGDTAEAKTISVEGLVSIVNGTITISSKDDGIKSKSGVEISGGLVQILTSVEGIESPNIIISNGEVHIQASDDALNATKGSGGEANDGSNLTISGGWVHISATAGDGVDSNGNFTLSGGTLLVHGPKSSPEVAVDINGVFSVTGGFTVMSSINSNMVETPSTQSTQRTVVLRTNQSISAGVIFHIEDSNGQSLLTFVPERNYSCITFTSPSLSQGTTYQIYTGGSYSGNLRDGLYTGGTYTKGTLRTSFTSTSVVQSVSF